MIPEALVDALSVSAPGGAVDVGPEGIRPDLVQDLLQGSVLDGLRRDDLGCVLRPHRVLQLAYHRRLVVGLSKWKQKLFGVDSRSC